MINLKKLNQNIPYIHFQNGGSFTFKGASPERGFFTQTRSKGCIFFSCTSQKFPEMSKIPMEAKSLRVSLLMLWPGTYSEDFHKTNENSDYISETFEYSVDNLPGQHLTGDSLQNIMLSRDTLIFILQNLGFIINFQKSVLNPSHQIQFLSVEIDSLTMIVSFSLQKKEQIMSQCQDLLNQSDV